VAANAVSAVPSDEIVRSDSKSPIVIDLGKHSRKRVKNLRKGTGRLADEVNGCLAELRMAGTVSPNAQTVVVVVRQRRGRNKTLKGLIPGF
jgi:Family of unknown function (DUF6200)